MEGPEKTKLRVALLIDSYYLPSWAAFAIENIVKSEYAETVLVVLNTSTKDDPPQKKIHPTEDNSKSWLWGLYSRFDNRISKIGNYYEFDKDPFEPEDTTEILKGIPVIEVNPVKNKRNHSFNDEEIEKLKEKNIDVAFQFGFRLLHGDVLDIFRYGIWSYHHGDSRFYRGGPPAFWECMNGEVVMGAELQILTSNLNAGKVIYRSWTKSERFSMKIGRYFNFWKSSYFAARKLRDLYLCGESSLNEVCDENEPIAYSTPEYKLPTNRRLIYYLCVQFLRLARSALCKLSRRQWFLAFKFSDIEHALDQDKKISDELGAKLKAAVEEFKPQFKE